MPEEYVECPEVCGKTIERVRIYKSTSEGTEMQIDLTDGTSLACSFCYKPEFEANLIRTAGSTLEILQTYELGTSN